MLYCTVFLITFFFLLKAHRKNIFDGNIQFTPGTDYCKGSGLGLSSKSKSVCTKAMFDLLTAILSQSRKVSQSCTGEPLRSIAQV